MRQSRPTLLVNVRPFSILVNAQNSQLIILEIGIVVDRPQTMTVRQNDKLWFQSPVSANERVQYQLLSAVR